MYAFCLPEQSKAIHEKIRGIEEEIWQELNIPYRVVNIAAGDLGAPAAKKYDIEYWSPHDQIYRELTSCSNCTDFQANTVNTRVRLADGTVKNVHTLNGKLGAIVGFNKEVPAELAKGIVMQVASMNPVAVSPEECPQEVIDNELKVAVEKTKEELVQKAVNAALEKAGINPAHVDSEDHIESNTAKGWITPEQADKAREIIRTVGEQKAASLPEQMVNNIAHGRLQKFFKEQTLMEQEYQMGDGKQSVKEVIAAADKDIKVLAFKRFSLND